MKKRIYSIDVLKLVFAYIIAFFHFGTTIAPGPTVAVQVFFIISGFFLGKKFYARSFADGGKSYSAWDYTLDHVTSIYPHYLFSLAAFFLYTLARSLVHLAISPSWDKVSAIADGAEKVNLLYVTGDTGLNVIAQGSFHAEVIDMLSNNLAVVDEPSSKGTGNEVDMEQILNWNPDVILFAPGSIYATVGEDAAWQSITAIRNGAYYEVPMGPYNWTGFPPSVQRLLGMLWMAKVLYPDAADYDLYTEAANYFQLFYHCDLTREQYDALVANSLGK